MDRRIFINNIIKILLMFSIMLAVLSVFIKYVALDKSTYLNILSKSNTYEQIKDSVYKKMDNVLAAKNINVDIKESIITEDDIKREADKAISGFVEYLKTGENNIEPIDTQIYKQRVADVLHTAIGNVIKPSNGELSFNDRLENPITLCSMENVKINTMAVNGQDTLKVQKLMTRDEAEAKVRDLLKKKGLTVEQAIKKAQEKGITEEQALKILAGYGITIDEDKTISGNSGDVQNKSENNTDFGAQNAKNPSSSPVNNDKDSQNEISTGNKADENKSQMSTNKSGLAAIENKLLEEAGKNIENEVEKVDFNKIAGSNKFKKLAQITSLIYKMFWIVMLIPIVFIIMLIRINSENINCGLKQIRNVFLCSGLILCVIFLSAYGLKVYEKINVNPIFQETMFYGIKHCLILLSTYGIVVVSISVLMFIPTGKNIICKKVTVWD